LTCQKTGLYSKDKLESWGEKFNNLSEKLLQQNVQTFYVIAPAKCSIYPEYSKEKLPAIGDRSRFDQFLDFMEKNNSGIHFIDPRSALIDAKNVQSVYYKTDTHWNDYGAYIVYKEIIKTVLPDIQEEEFVAFDSLKTTRKDYWIGPLGKFLAIDKGFGENWFNLKPETQTTVSEENGYFVFENPNAPSELTVLVFHDSFFSSSASGAIKSFIAEHFRKTIFLDRNRGFSWNPSGPELLMYIETLDPDILIVERTERNLLAFAEGDPFKD
jgi:hypothetical protein